MTEFLYFYYYYNRSWLTNLRVSRISDPIILGPRQNIETIHVFSCINICRVPRKLFEHEAVRLSVQTSSEGPGKC